MYPFPTLIQHLFSHAIFIALLTRQCEKIECSWQKSSKRKIFQHAVGWGGNNQPNMSGTDRVACRVMGDQHSWGSWQRR